MAEIIKAKIIDRSEVEIGTTKAGKQFQKIYITADTGSEYSNLKRIEFYESTSKPRKIVESIQNAELNSEYYSISFEAESRKWVSPQGETKWFTTLRGKDFNSFTGYEDSKPKQEAPEGDLPF